MKNHAIQLVDTFEKLRLINNMALQQNTTPIEFLT